MTSSLAPVLSCTDLPFAELQAARIDGELFGIDECFSPIDLPEQSTQRARALARFLPERLIAEQLTAAWIWGVLSVMPARHQFCVAAGARARPANPRKLSIREVVIEEHDLLVIGGLLITSPRRTAIDLIRCSPAFDSDDRSLVLRLLHLAGSSVHECRQLLNSRRNLPGKRLSRARLNELEACLPALPETESTEPKRAQPERTIPIHTSAGRKAA